MGLRALWFVVVVLGCAVRSESAPPTPEEIEAGAPSRPALIEPAEPVTRPASVENPWGDCTPRKWRASSTRMGEFPPRGGDHLVTLLPDGKVLLGQAMGLYDPVADKYEGLPSVPPQRNFGTATVLADKHTILLAGGGNDEYGGTRGAYLYDYVTKAYRSAAPMNAPRAAHRAVLMPNGKVLVVGGQNDDGAATVPNAEIYDPATDTWGVQSWRALSSGFAAVEVIKDGRVLVGQDGIAPALWVYEPEAETWRFK